MQRIDQKLHWKEHQTDDGAVKKLPSQPMVVCLSVLESTALMEALNNRSFPWTTITTVGLSVQPSGQRSAGKWSLIFFRYFFRKNVANNSKLLDIDAAHVTTISCFYLFWSFPSSLKTKFEAQDFINFS